MTLSGKRILVLEDEAIIAFGLEDMLVEEGGSVQLACSTAEAQSLIEAGAFDCAILDVNLHGEKSYPIAYRLLADGIPIIFATGYGDAEHPADLGRVPTITKPYTLDQIKEAFSSLP